ncbi:Peroxisomal adenine nucleotide carrier 1 (GmPNC1), partial [Durusdinium trenchii]
MANISVWEKVWSEVRSGLVSSVGAEAALFPLDTVKLQQQVYGGTAASVLKRLVAQKGLRGVYQGLIGRLIQTITSNVGFFVWQTVFVQLSLRQVQAHQPGQEKLGTVTALIVNMLAQQINRLLTTPFDVVASVNQADPNSKGFFHTFYRMGSTGGVKELWRGLPVALLLSLNPALMFTLVGKLSDFVKALRKTAPEGFLSSSDMFWISGISKAVATLLTYPLIRAKAVIQTTGGDHLGLWGMLAGIVRKEGWLSLYQGVWIMSYKTVLFNSLMMALKQKVSLLLMQWDRFRDTKRRQEKQAELEGQFRKNVTSCCSLEMPWEAAARGQSVMYVDGSWCFLHDAQAHILREGNKLADHLIVGVHSDEIHQESVGTWPAECYAERLRRLRRKPWAATILENAPWEVSAELLEELSIEKVLGGSVTKIEDCTGGSPRSPERSDQLSISDPYAECKRRGIFEEVKSLNASTEHDEWMRKVMKIAFSNVDASIDWLQMRNFPEAWMANNGAEIEPKLRKLLSTFGDVTGLQINNTPGEPITAKASFAEPAMADKAVQALHGVDMRTAKQRRSSGRPPTEDEKFWAQIILPETAKPAREEPSQETYLLVEGFPTSWTEAQLRATFLAFGGVERLTHVPDSRYGRIAKILLKDPDAMERVVSELHGTRVGDGDVVEECVLHCKITSAAVQKKEEEARQKREEKQARKLYRADVRKRREEARQKKGQEDHEEPEEPEPKEPKEKVKRKEAAKKAAARFEEEEREELRRHEEEEAERAAAAEQRRKEDEAKKAAAAAAYQEELRQKAKEAAERREKEQQQREAERQKREEKRRLWEQDRMRREEERQRREDKRQKAEEERLRKEEEERQRREEARREAERKREE